MIKQLFARCVALFNSAPLVEPPTTEPKVNLKGTKLLPFALIDISQAPKIVLREATGDHAEICFCNIQKLRFQEVVQEWGKSYSLVFPKDTEWTNFYAVWKNFLQ